MNDDRRRTRDDEARFDAELSRAARALVSEDLPRGVLDEAFAQGGGPLGNVRARRAMPAYAGLATALVLLLAASVALLPGGTPPASPSPATSAQPTGQPSPSPSATRGTPGTLRTTAQIRADFERLGYACVRGNVLLPTGPSPSAPVLEGAVCTAPADAGPYIASVIVSEARDGSVVELAVKADLTGKDSTAAREAIAVPLAKAVAVAVSGQGTGDRVAAWVLGAAPLLGQGSGNSATLVGFAVKIVRNSSGTYQLFLHPA